MNKVLDFRNFMVQYWVEEFPQLSKVSTLTDYETLNGLQDIDFINTKKICIELYLHRNANNYGLLGFEFNSKTNQKGLEVEIKYTDENTEHYQSKINKYDKTIYCGLTKEYVPYIKSRILDKIQKKNRFYNGTLIVSCAANSEVGSSPMMFGLISDIIVELFLRIQDKGNIDDCLKDILYVCELIKEKY